MNLATAYQSIAAVEARFSVEDLRLDDVDLWLPIRDIFIRPFFEYRLLIYNAILRASSHSDPLDWSAIEGRDLAFEGAPHYRYRAVGDLALFNKHGEFYGERSYSQPVDIMVFHAFTDYGETVQRRIFNRVSDGLVQLYPDKARVVKLMRTTATAPLLPYYNPVHFFAERDGERGLRDPLPDEGPLLKLLEEIVEWSRKQGLPLVYEREGMLNRLRTMFWRASNFQRAISYFAPNAIYLSSYSNIERTAMTLAGWREGVPVADVEHGFMGPFSPYGRLGAIGATGSRVLPRYFWCWGEENRAFIERSLPQGCRAHAPVVGGSTWHRARAQLVADGVLAEERPAELPSEYRKRLTAARRVVYFCWQPDMLVHEEKPHLLPPHFLEAAASAPADVLFCLRLHPRSHHLIQHFARVLRDHGVANWEIEYSTRYPLLDILPLADVMITSYSTVAFEANELRVPVIVIDRFGRRMMQDYVDRGVFRACVDVDSLREAILTLGPQDAPRVHYMSSDPHAHVQAFERVTNGMQAGPERAPQ